MSLPASPSSGDVSPAAIPFIPGDIVDGKYRVEEVLGTGGMGVVLAARHIALDSEVAVKVLHPQFQQDPVVRERFLREARSAANLRSSHVTRIIDVGTDRLGAPYIVMERLHGKDLEKLLAERGPLEEHVAVDYVLQACEAIAEAHAAGIVHRDLKPENIFVTREIARERVKILDFGISKSISETKKLTGPGDVMGTPHFMSPEQFKSTRDVTARTDVWALGAILYRLVTGALPFDGKNFVELCTQIMTGAPMPIEQRKNVTPAVAAIVRRCLANDPMHRFANAAELREALSTALTQSKTNHRNALAATLPLSKVPAPKRRYRGAFFVLGAIAAGLIAVVATHPSQVLRAIKPAPIQAEAPAVLGTEPLEAPASTAALALNDEKAPTAKVSRSKHRIR